MLVERGCFWSAPTCRRFFCDNNSQSGDKSSQAPKKSAAEIALGGAFDCLLYAERSLVQFGRGAWGPNNPWLARRVLIISSSFAFCSGVSMPAN